MSRLVTAALTPWWAATALTAWWMAVLLYPNR